MNRIVTRSLRYEPPQLRKELISLLDGDDDIKIRTISLLEKQLKEQPFESFLPDSVVYVPQKKFEFRDGERYELRVLVLGNDDISVEKVALGYGFTESLVVVTGVKAL